MAVETITIDGTPYTIEELESLLGPLEPPYDLEELQQLIEESQNDSSEALAALLAALAVIALSRRAPSRRIIYSIRDKIYFRNGQRLTDSQIKEIIFAEQQRNAMRFRRRTQSLIDGNISFEQWQDDMARDLIRSHFRMGQAGAGGASQLTPNHLQRIRNNIREELDYFQKFSDDLANGRLSEKMALYRAGRYGQSSGSSYYTAEQLRYDNGWLAWRRLDPSADHCPDCPGHATNGWVPIGDVVPVGTQCQCRGNCRCNVQYRRRRDVNLSDMLSVG